MNHFYTLLLACVRFIDHLLSSMRCVCVWLRPGDGRKRQTTENREPKKCIHIVTVEGTDVHIYYHYTLTMTLSLYDYIHHLYGAFIRYSIARTTTGIYRDENARHGTHRNREEWERREQKTEKKRKENIVDKRTNCSKNIFVSGDDGCCYRSLLLQQQQPASSATTIIHIESFSLFRKRWFRSWRRCAAK